MLPHSMQLLVLMVLQFNNNAVADWKEVAGLSHCPRLTCVYLEHNPIAGDVMYRKKLMLALPALKQIDATFCRK